MAKNHYLKTLEVVNSAQTAVSFLNSLLKIATETEDGQLRQLLGAGIKLVRHTVEFGGGTKKSLLPPHQAWKDLNQYCVTQANTQKPEWQVLAERAGWRPPSAA